MYAYLSLNLFKPIFKAINDFVVNKQVLFNLISLIILNYKTNMKVIQLLSLLVASVAA